MRICLVTAYDLSRDGGVNRHVLGLAQALRALGDEVAILGPAGGQLPAGCVGLPGVVGIPGNGSMAHIGLAVHPRRTLRFLRESSFDLLHLHAPLIPGPARQAVAHASHPMVGTFHAFAERESRLSRCVRSIARWPLGRLRAGIAVSEAAKGFSRALFAGPMHVIPCGITASDFQPAQQTPAPDTPPRKPPMRVLFVGRFCEPRKGLRYLLSAADKLHSQGHPMHISVAGVGQKKRFARITCRAPLHFLGRVDDTALAQHYRDADIFCAPSVGSESFGLVLIEAMSAGTPVVATDIPGYAEATQGCARLVPPRAVDALATALWQVHNDTTLRTQMRAAGQARARALDWQRVAPQVRAVYEAALANR